MDKLLKSIGAKIREERKKSNFSLDELAERAQLHPTYIGGIERGERNPTITNLDKIADALNLSLSQLLKINYDYDSNVDDQIIISDISDIYVSQNPETKDIIKKMIKTLGGKSGK